MVGERAGDLHSAVDALPQLFVTFRARTVLAGSVRPRFHLKFTNGQASVGLAILRWRPHSA